MRIAIAGKGGAGKTTICATAARLLARAGMRVVAIDGDSNPNLHAALGLAGEAPVTALPTSLVSRRFDGPRLTESVHEVLLRHSVPGPDGVKLLRMGMPQHADEGCLCSAHATVSALLADLANLNGASSQTQALPRSSARDTRADSNGSSTARTQAVEGQATVTLLDLEASPEHLSRGTARHCDFLLLVAEPYYRSLEAVRLQARLASETTIERVAVVANKCRRPDDIAAIKAYCSRHDLELIGSVEWSDAVLDADAASLPLIDFAPNDPVVFAVDSIVTTLLGRDPSDSLAHRRYRRFSDESRCHESRSSRPTASLVVSSEVAR